MAAVDVFVPDVLENYPWKRDLNSHHESTSIGCREWLRAFEMFDTKSTLAFDKCDSREWPTHELPCRLERSHLEDPDIR